MSGPPETGRARRARVPRGRGILLPGLLLHLLLGLALATGASAAPEPDGGVAIHATLGFSGTFRLGRWTPLTVSVENRGPDLVGDLEARIEEGDDLQGSLFSTVHRRRLELPRGARKRIRLTVFPESLVRPLVVRFVAGGREIARREIDLRRHFFPGRLVLVLSRDADLDYLNDGDVERVRVLYPHPDRLPSRWQGYDGVEAMVIHGVSLERLEPAQFEALEKWVARGGVLAVSGGPDRSLLRTPRLAGLLPATPVGTARIGDPAALGAALGLRLEGTAPVDVNRVARWRGQVRRRLGDLPLVVEAPRGRGRVVYLTFDVARPPFDGAAGMRRLWLDVLRLPPAEGDLAAGAPPGGAGHPALALVNAYAPGFPGHGTLIVFLGLYLGILVIGYRPGDRDRGGDRGGAGRRLPAWMVWGAPVVFAPAAHLLFGPLLFPAGATAVSLSLIEPHPRGPYADLRLDLGFYANERRPLRLDYDGVRPALRPLAWRAREGATPDWIFGHGRPPSAGPAHPRPFVLYDARGEDVVPFDLTVSVQREGGGPRLRVRNGSGRALRGAWLLLDGGVHPLGTLGGEADLDRRLGRAAATFTPATASWSRMLDAVPGLAAADRRAARAVLEQALGGPGSPRYPRPGEALLVALSSSPFRLAGASARWARIDLALVLARARLEDPAPGRRSRGRAP